MRPAQQPGAILPITEILVAWVAANGPTNKPERFSTEHGTNLETANDEIGLRGNPTNSVVDFEEKHRPLERKLSAIVNTTGQFVALGDQGYNSVTKQFTDISVSSSSGWNYREYCRARIRA